MGWLGQTERGHSVFRNTAYDQGGAHGVGAVLAQGIVCQLIARGNRYGRHRALGPRAAQGKRQRQSIDCANGCGVKAGDDKNPI
jgi:hypothetical protein